MQGKLYTIILAIIAMLYLNGGCSDLIYDDLSKCPQGVNIHFFEQTPCESTPRYPTQFKQVQVFVFDEHNILVETYQDNDIQLSAEYKLKTPFYKVGTFTFVAWASDNLSTFSFTDFEKGKTTKTQMLLSLESQTNQLTVEPHRLYYGVSEPLPIEDRSKIGSIFNELDIRMQEFTNRLNFKLHGLASIDTYEVTITDNNNVYNFAGDFAGKTRFNYTTSAIAAEQDRLFNAKLVVLKLAEKRDARITITNTTTGKVVYSANLIDDLIMYAGDNGTPPYKLECVHDFDIDIQFDPSEHPNTYMIVRATINNWNVIERPVILGL